MLTGPLKGMPSCCRFKFYECGLRGNGGALPGAVRRIGAILMAGRREPFVVAFYRGAI